MSFKFFTLASALSLSSSISRLSCHICDSRMVLASIAYSSALMLALQRTPGTWIFVLPDSDPGGATEVNPGALLHTGWRVTMGLSSRISAKVNLT